MPNIVNEMAVREMAEAFKEASGMVIVSMSGLTMVENEELRSDLAEKGVELRMVRNNLARRALESSGFEFEADVFQGNVGVAWGGPEEAIHAAKVFTGPKGKGTGKVQIRAGFLEGNVLGEADAAALADVPDRDTLNAQLLGCISGPARSLVGLLAANQGALARVLQARVDEGDGASEG